MMSESLSGEFQAVSGRNLPADAGWETGTDLSAPRGRPRTSPQQLRIFLDVLTYRSLWFYGRVERNSRGPGVVGPSPFERFPFFLWSSRASPIKSSARKPSGKDRFSSGLAGILVSEVCRGQCCSAEPLARFSPASPV